MTDSLDPARAFAAAVEALGGQSPTARLVGVTQGAIWQRLNGQKAAAPAWVLRLEAATGISRHRLRPDVYGPAPAVTSEALSASAGDTEIAR